MSNEYNDGSQPVEQGQATNEQYVDPNQQVSYDDYYGGQSMDYSATQIENYEQGYDANAYANYYDQYLTTNAQKGMYDLQVHKEQYEYFVQHKDEIRSYFPKKRKIVRWEDEGAAYNSLEAAEEFMDLLAQMQEDQASQQANKKNEYDDID